MSPGPELAEWLTSSDPAYLDDADLIDAAAAWERLTSWAQAGQMAVLGELARRRPASGETRAAVRERGDPTGVSEFAADEVAPALRLSRSAAASRVALAIELRTRLAGTFAALARGELDMSKTRTVADATRPLSDENTAAVERRVLDRASRQTVGQLRASVGRAVIAVDPDGAERRHARARKDRRLVFSPLPDGMAELWALLPATGAAAAYNRVDQYARAAKTAGDDRSADERRADALVDLITSDGDHTEIPAGGAHGDHPSAPRAAAPAQAPASSSHGAADATTAGLMAPTRGTDADPAANAASPDAAAAYSAASGPTATAATNASRDGFSDAPMDSPADDPVPDLAGSLGPAPRPLVEITVPASTLLGVSTEPGELAGYGSLPASVAREIAADATWRRLVTDPQSGTLLDYGRTRYTPPQALADYVRARDRTCRFPGCRRSARQSDLDHTTSYPGGPTSAANLGTLCRHHHRLKQQPGWSVVQDERSVFTWTSPTGHTYITEPDPAPIEPVPLSTTPCPAAIPEDMPAARGTHREPDPPF